MPYAINSRPMNIRPMQTLALSVMVTILSWLPESYANTASLTQTQTQLKQLDTRINTLQHTLKNAHNKNGLLHKELANTDKKISLSVQQLISTKRDLANMRRTTDDLQEQINALNILLQQQRHALAEHVIARYKMGEYQPIKWLLNQNEPNTISRLFAYYQYVMRSHQHTLDSVLATQDNLTNTQNKWRKEILAQQTLQQELHHRQQKLTHEKLYQTALIQSLDVEIHNKQQALDESEQSRNNLTKLLKSLTEQSVRVASYPFVHMRKKLPRPIGSAGPMQSMNQGVTFFAKEGTPVMAVYSGKVVFSDWLKGYGLLLILDHGDGFMTLYANNEALFKQKGDKVTQGEQIATVGHSGGLKQNGLYFEVRQRGKAIPPLAWMS